MSIIRKKKRVEMSIEERLALIEERTKEAEKLIRKPSEAAEALYKQKVSEAIRAGGERSKLLIRIYEEYSQPWLETPVAYRLSLFEGNEKLQVLMLRTIIDNLKGGKK